MLTQAVVSTKPPIVQLFEGYFTLLHQNTKQYIFQCKKGFTISCCHDIHIRKSGSDIQFKIRYAEIDAQCGHTHKHCCFCFDIT